MSFHVVSSSGEKIEVPREVEAKGADAVAAFVANLEKPAPAARSASKSSKAAED